MHTGKFGPPFTFYAGFTAPTTGKRRNASVRGSGSKASSSRPPADLHRPSALWKASFDYCSSSQPLS